ncbi:MAG: AMP-binding protein [Halorientalis sp.]
MVSAPRPTDWPVRPAEFPISTVTELLEEKTAENGDDVFLVEDETGRELTYAELDERTDAVAAALADLGVGEGDRVATFMPNVLEHVLVWFGTLKAGAVWASLNTDLEEEDLRQPIADIEASVVVVDESCLAQYESVRDGLDVDAEFVREGDLAGARPISALFDADADPPAVDVAPGDPAQINFTGGTTGTPKPILLPHFAVVASGYRYREAFDATADDRHLTVLQVFHVGGQQFGVIGPMLCDMSSVLVRRFSASAFFEQVNEHEATIVDPLGGIWGALLRTHEGTVENTARVGVGSMDPEFVRPAHERFDIDIVEPYALSENGGVLMTYHELTEDDYDTIEEGRGKPAGYVEECDWAVFDIRDEDGDPVETGEVGEICLRPVIPHTFMEEYFGHPEATVEAWDGFWLHTGDLGRIDEEGMFYFVGRQAHYLRRMGENISAQEIEAVLERHGAVAEAVVVGVPSEIGEEDIKAYVIRDGDVTPEELVAFCEGKIASFKHPRYVEFVDSFPRSDTKNNVQRHDLRERGVGDAWDREAQ